MRKLLHHVANAFRNIGGISQQTNWQMTHGVDCAVRVCTLEDASIQHPMSIHSAPIGTSRQVGSIQAILRYIMVLFLCIFCFGVRSAWAVDWASLGVSTIEDNAEYYIYNTSAQAFITYTFTSSTKAVGSLSTQLTDAKCFTAVPKVIQNEDTYYNLKSTDNAGGVACAFNGTTANGNWKSTGGTTLKISGNGTEFQLARRITSPTDPIPSFQNYYVSSLQICEASSEADNANHTSTDKFVFISKATFDANKWLTVAATSIELGQDYYIYNVGKKCFFGFESLTTQLNEALSFKPEYNSTYGLYAFKSSKKYDATKYYYLKIISGPWGTTANNCALHQNNGIYYIAKRNVVSQNPTTYSYQYVNASSTTEYSLLDDASDYSGVDADGQWIFIPKDDFDVFFPMSERELDREDDWTNLSSTVPSSSGWYYLYNPASQCFLGKNTSANPSVSTDPDQAVMFYVKKSSSTYGFSYTDQANPKYVGASTTAATSVVYFTPEQTSTNRYHLQNGGTYFYVTPNGSNWSFSVGTTPNEYSRWVFIPRNSYVTKMALDAASAPTDKWLAKAAELSEGGLYYVYNPASKRFLGNKSLSSEDRYAILFHVVKNAGGKFALMYTNDVLNGETVTSVNNTVASWSDDSGETYLDVVKKTTKANNRYTINTKDLSSNYRYVVTYKSGSETYRLNTVLGNSTNYPYGTSTSGTPKTVKDEDVWNEWLFIPASEYEAEIATTPSTPDTWGSQGAVPEIGKQYFLYNVEAQKFLKKEYLSSSTEEAALCTIGGTEEAKVITFVHNGVTYKVCARPQGYTTNSYVLDWDETATDSKQYFIYHNVQPEMMGMVLLDYNIHLGASKDYSQFTGTAIKTGSRPADISGKYKWAFIEPTATLYYSASTEVYAGQGDVYVYFGTPGLSASTGTISEGSLSASLVKTATFMAMPETGYQFMGWKLDPDGGFISTEMMYEYNLTVSSTDSEHTDNVTLYAYFEKYDAEVYNTNGIKQGDYETLAGAITAASKGYTIKLKRNITSAQTINKGVIIDFNGYTISGNTDNLVTVSAPSTDTVTFVDNSIAGNGGVKLAYSEAQGESSYTAMKVTGGTLVINNGYYDAAQTWTAYERSGKAYVLNCAGGKVRVNGGYFKATKYGAVNQVTDYVHLFNGSNITLYGGYYACGSNSDNVNNVSSRVGTGIEAVDSGDAVYNIKLQSSVASNVVATVNGVGFMSLADAIAYTNNNAGTDMVIRLAKDHTLPAGTYTIPAKVTLIVPYNALHTEPAIACPLVNSSRLPNAAYRTLTLASGVHIDVFGAIELGGCAYSYGNGATGTGRPNSDYGHLVMESNSQIVLNNGAKFRAWGFVTGSGAIDVRRGARVDEMFQVYDFKGGNGTLAMYTSGHKSFPIQQYFIQNVEVKTTYRPGSALYGTMAAVATGMSVKIIGKEGESSSLFMMDNEDDSEDTWVCKWYDPTTDQQVYDINNSAQISNLFLPLSKITGVEGSDFDSKEYILPITNNMKIHLLSGDMYITQDVAFLPGAEMEINKLCTGHINKNTTTYLYDSNEWGPYTYNNVFASKIKYRPGGLQHERNISSAAGLGDAKANIHGTIEVNGSFRTTEGGANIYSTNEDAGTVSFTEDAVTTYVETRDTLCTWTSQVYHPASIDNGWKASATPYYAHPAAYPAKLKNETGEPFAQTQGTTVGEDEVKSFCYINNQWRLLTNDGCMVTDGENYYIKPREYVQLSSNLEDGDHLYHNVGNTRDFIQTFDRGGNCQWWEVEDVPGHPELKHSIHPENDVYYYYDDETYDTWVEKKFSITWKNWDGSLIETYEMKMGAKLQYLGSTPSRAKSAYYTYDFAGWSPAISEDAVVTGDATYTAQFNQTDRKYLITFTGKANWGVDSKQEYLGMGEIPTPPDLGVMAGMIMWTPAISPVTGDANYEVVAADPFATSFSIKFVNWDGTELQSGSVDAGEMPEYAGETPVKPALDGEENYIFDGWTPTIAAATADAVYMAKYKVQKVEPLFIVNEQTIADARVLTDLHITTTGSLNITGSVTADNFYLESDGSAHSGQFIGGYEKLTINGNAYFDLKADAKNHKWYSVAVPWQVDAEGGISVNGRVLEFGKDFDILYYDGAERAASGSGGWKYMEDTYGAGYRILQPGKLYMIGLLMDAPTIRFAKTGGALLTTTTSVTAYSGAAASTNHGWNGIANPALFHAFVNPGVTAAQVYNPTNNSYDPILMNSAKFVVGQSAFVQVSSDKAITVSYGGAYAAPRRERAEEAPLYDVQIAPVDAALTDRLFVTTEEDKADRYVIGKDLAKMGVSSQVAQMWINRYDAKLCMNTQALVNGVAEYPLTLFAPKADEYTIHSTPYTSDSDYDLYLTQNAEAIWNLSDGAYTFSLPKGNTAEYGLRISAKAPEVATGIDEAVVDAQGETRKVLLDQKVFIIRGNNIYSIDGRLVK